MEAAKNFVTTKVVPSVIDCEKFPNAYGCDSGKGQSFVTRAKDTACSVALKACSWGLLPKKMCEGLRVSCNK